MNEDEQGRVLAALMLAAGTDEIRVSDELLIGHGAVVLRYRDELRDETVFRLVRKSEVIDGAAVVYEIEARRELESRR